MTESVGSPETGTTLIGATGPRGAAIVRAAASMTGAPGLVRIIVRAKKAEICLRMYISGYKIARRGVYQR